MIKLTEIVILWVYYTIPFGLSLIRHFWGIFFNFLNYFGWLRITDEGSVPEMRIWSILLIKSALKWCIHLSRSLCSYTNNFNVQIQERCLFVRSICLIQLKFSWIYVRNMLSKFRVINGEYIVKISRGIVELVYEV